MAFECQPIRLATVQWLDLCVDLLVFERPCPACLMVVLHLLHAIIDTDLFLVNARHKMPLL